MTVSKLSNAIAVLLLCGCLAQKPGDPERPVSNTTKGTAIGAAVGAVAGAAINHDNRGKGAAIGAVLGGGAGALLGYRSEHQIVELREAMKGSTVAVDQQGDAIRIVIPGEVGFASGNAKVRSSFRDELDQLAKSLKRFPQTRIEVIGHADDDGLKTRDAVLALDRAMAIVDYIADQGVSRDRMESGGRGWAEPLASNATATGRAKNRRVEVRIRPQKEEALSAK